MKGNGVGVRWRCDCAHPRAACGSGAGRWDHPRVSDSFLEGLPHWIWDVPYVGTAYPGAVPRASMREGANCQLFAYEVLALHDRHVPDWWSSELWEDEQRTTRVTEAAPLDLVLFNATQDSHSAHVGVVVDGDQVLHLCAEVGHPAVWRKAEFAVRLRYATVVGYKRVVL